MAFTEKKKILPYLTLLRIGKGTKGSQRSQPTAMSPLPVTPAQAHLWQHIPYGPRTK